MKCVDELLSAEIQHSAPCLCWTFIPEMTWSVFPHHPCRWSSQVSVIKRAWLSSVMWAVGKKNSQNWHQCHVTLYFVAMFYFSLISVVKMCFIKRKKHMSIICSDKYCCWQYLLSLLTTIKNSVPNIPKPVLGRLSLSHAFIPCFRFHLWKYELTHRCQWMMCHMTWWIKWKKI